MKDITHARISKHANKLLQELADSQQRTSAEVLEEIIEKEHVSYYKTNKVWEFN